jgi:hypothetical protein
MEAIDLQTEGFGRRRHLKRMPINFKCAGRYATAGEFEGYDMRNDERPNKMTAEELRFEITVLEWSHHQWEQGRMSTLEGGERITAKHVAAWRRQIEELKQQLAGSELREC